MSAKHNMTLKGKWRNFDNLNFQDLSPGSIIICYTWYRESRKGGKQWKMKRLDSHMKPDDD